MQVSAAARSGRPSSPPRIVPPGPFIRFDETETEQSIAARFEQQVRQHGQRLAAKTERHALTYEVLNRMANRVASAILATRGADAEPVALLFEHDVPLIAAMLGVLKTGKFYVPLDPHYPPARTAAMLEETGAALIVTDSRMAQRALELAGQARSVLNVDQIGEGASTENPGLVIAPDAYAYLLFTSGSTGLPKGIVESHRNVLHFTLAHTNRCYLCPDDRLPLFVSCSFSGSASRIYGALLNGASLHLLDLRAAGMGRLYDWLVREEITILWGSVGFGPVIQALKDGGQLPRVRLVFWGAQTLHKRDVELYRKYFADDCLLLNALGTTEMKAICRYIMDKRTVIDGPTAPVGYPDPDTEIVLLGDDGMPLGSGEVGEITVKSRYIAPAYWRQPELTRATFVAGPDGGDERTWRTGDLGRMRPDGCLEHRGRKDFQVKVRGHRVELGEVEAALLDAPGVADCVVTAAETKDGGARLVAYVVPAPGHTSTVTELRAALDHRLPAYMLPSVFVPLPTLPRNPSGKVDRLRLPKPGRDRGDLANSYVAPRTPLETLLAGIWCDLLGLEQVGIHDDFLELGGDSLLAAGLISRIRDALPHDLPLDGLLRASTVADQAAALLQLEIATRPEGELARALIELDGAPA